MEINGRIISGLDPGAIPGGSTNPSSGGYRSGSMGPISIDRRVKTFLCLGVGLTRFGSFFLNANDNFAEEYPPSPRNAVLANSE